MGTPPASPAPTRLCWPPGSAPTLMVVSGSWVAAASLSRVAVSGYCPLRNSARGPGCNQPLRWGDPPKVP